MALIPGHDLADYKCAPAFAHTLGPRNARIALVGEAWGEQEALAKAPFVGKSGQELTSMLGEAGIKRKDCFLTNTFALRPPRNSMEELLIPTALRPTDYPLLQYRKGRFINPLFLGEVWRLREELEAVKPNLVVALGATAMWALMGLSQITMLRGTIAESTLVPGLKVLPTFHPAGVLRQWSNRPIAVADLTKAARELEFPEIRRPKVQVTVNPTLDEVRAFAARQHGEISFDVETKLGQITMISLSEDTSHSLVIPFWDTSKPEWSYWERAEDEVEVRKLLRSILDQPCPKVAQNGLYDLQYLIRDGIPVRNFQTDTMLAHHSLYPELQKGLGFLASIYTSQPAWKLWHKSASTKADE